MTKMLENPAVRYKLANPSVTSLMFHNSHQWRQGSHIGVPKQNSGHVDLPNKSCGSWNLFLCKDFLLLQWNCIASGNMSGIETVYMPRDWHKEGFASPSFKRRSHGVPLAALTANCACCATVSYPETASQERHGLVVHYITYLCACVVVWTNPYVVNLLITKLMNS